MHSDTPPGSILIKVIGQISNCETCTYYVRLWHICSIQFLTTTPRQYWKSEDLRARPTTDNRIALQHQRRSDWRHTSCIGTIEFFNTQHSRCRSPSTVWSMMGEIFANAVRTSIVCASLRNPHWNRHRGNWSVRSNERDSSATGRSSDEEFLVAKSLVSIIIIIISIPRSGTWSGGVGVGDSRFPGDTCCGLTRPCPLHLLSHLCSCQPPFATRLD